MTKLDLSRRGFLGMAAGTTAAVAATAADEAPAPVISELYPTAEMGPTPATVRIVTSQQFTPEEAAAVTRLAPKIELVQCRNRDEVYAAIANADAFFGMADRETIRRGTRLKWIQNSVAGVEGLVEIPELLESKIVLTNMQRVFAPVISETAIGLLLALARGFPTYVRQGDRKQWKSAPDLMEISSRTMGVIGFGGLGSETARRAHYGFGMRIIATDAKPLPKPHWVDELRDPGWQAELVRQSDAVVVAAPETKLTRGMVNEAFLKNMKKTAFLIAISRGTLYDGEAVARALKEGWIAGAGLDVTPREPLPADDPLWTAPNAIITCHTSGYAPERRGRVMALFTENLRRYVNGLPLLNVVDKARGY
jgi:phosphoglycerate dehydrogenase-like enzyme